MSEDPSSPKIIKIKKYQNRRYYDTTNSCHLGLAKIHELICQGFDIQVTDAKSGQDITNKILAQILIEYEPMKLDFFSPRMLTQVIRVNDLILKDFYDVYFNKALQAFMGSKDQFEALLRQSQMLPFLSPMGGKKPAEGGLPPWFGVNPFASVAAKSREGDDPGLSEMEELKQQIEALKEQLKK